MADKVIFIKNKVRFNLTDAKKLSGWIESVAKKEKFKIAGLSYVFCNDSFLLNMNKEFLNHDYLTDIITFDLSEERGVLSGEIYISVDRVKENASLFKVPFQTELRRVIIHGVLHLMGYKDKGVVNARKMREKEDSCLSLLK